MDRATGIRVATEICSGCERRGPPALMWDPAGKILKYLHCEVGMSDSESTMRQNILNADVDTPEESVIAATQQGKKEGLVSVIPEGMCGKLADYAADVPSKRAGNEDPETTHPKGLDLSSPAKTTQLDPMANMIELIKTSIATSSAATSSSQAPSSQTQLLQTILLNAFAQPSPVKDETQPPPKEEKVLRVKTKSEKLWQENMALGRKIQGMVSHGRSIVKQTEDETNAWWWARNELTDLQASMDKVQPVVDKWNVAVYTSSFPTFCKANGDNSEAALLALQVDIESATTSIEKQLSILVGMHNTRLKRLSLEGQVVEPKAEKGKSKAAAKAK